MYNILINNLSLVYIRPNINTYYLKGNEADSQTEHELTFKGYFTNEPVTNVLLRKFANEGKGEKLDKIISLTSDKVQNAKIGFKVTETGTAEEKELEKECMIDTLVEHLGCQAEEIRNLTHYQYYKNYVKNKTSEEYEILPDEEGFSETVPDMQFIKIPDIPEAEDIHKAVVDLSKTIIQLYEDHAGNCRLFMDYTGGDRSTSTLLIALTKMLELRDIHIDRIWAVNYDEKAHRSEIREKIAVNRIFDFISGLNEFLNYGRSNILMEYFGVADNLRVTGEKGTKEDILQKIQQLSDQIQLCRSAKIVSSIGELVNSVKAYKPTNEPIFDYLIEDIKKNYADIYENNQRTVINIIRWCLKKNLIQQAVTMYAELIPKELVSQRIVYYTDMNWIDSNCDKNFTDEYNFINSYLLRTIGNSTYISDSRKYYKKRAEYIVSVLKNNSPSGICLGRNINDKKLINLLNNYQYFKFKIRHVLNHASSNQFSIDEIREGMDWKNKEALFKNSDGTSVTYIGVRKLTEIMNALLDQLQDLGMN